MIKTQVFYQYNDLTVKEYTAKTLKLDKGKMRKVILRRETYGELSPKAIRDRKTRHGLMRVGIVW